MYIVPLNIYVYICMYIFTCVYIYIYCIYFQCIYIHPSIHSLPLIWGRVTVAGAPGFLLPSNTLELLGDPEAFPGQMRYIIPPAGSGSAPRSPPSRTCPEYLEGEAPGRHPNQMPKPPHLTPFDAGEQRLYSKLPPELLTLSLRLSRATLQRKHISATCISNLVLLVTTQCS